MNKVFIVVSNRRNGEYHVNTNVAVFTNNTSAQAFIDIEMSKNRDIITGERSSYAPTFEIEEMEVME